MRIFFIQYLRSIYYWAAVILLANMLTALVEGKRDFCMNLPVTFVILLLAALIWLLFERYRSRKGNPES